MFYVIIYCQENDPHHDVLLKLGQVRHSRMCKAFSSEHINSLSKIKYR